MNERELLVDFLRRLNRTGVTYYLTGSMASNHWGIPRTTHDLDFVVQLPCSAVVTANPNGIQSSSPGLPASGYPGNPVTNTYQP